MGCSTATSLVTGIKKIRRNPNPDFLFIEPSEMVVTQEMRNVTAMGRRDVAYDLGPFITLVDGPGFQAVWRERQPLLLGHIAGSDLVAVSRADLIAAEKMAEIVNTLTGYCNDVLRLSARSGSGLEEVVKIVRGA